MQADEPRRLRGMNLSFAVALHAAANKKIVPVFSTAQTATLQ